MCQNNAGSGRVKVSLFIVNFSLSPAKYFRYFIVFSLALLVQCTGEDGSVIMAHPPDNVSDLSLALFLDTVIKVIGK